MFWTWFWEFLVGLKDWYWWVLKGDEIEGKIGKKEVPKLNGKPKLQPSWNLGSTFGQKSEVFMEYNQRLTQTRKLNHIPLKKLNHNKTLA